MVASGLWEADGLKLVWGRDGVLMAGGDRDFGGQEEGKGRLHGIEHHPVPSTSREQGAAHSRTFLAGGGGLRRP